MMLMILPGFGGAVLVLSWLWQFEDLKTSHGPAFLTHSNKLLQRKEEVMVEGGCPWGGMAQKGLLTAHLMSERTPLNMESAGLVSDALGQARSRGP